MSERLDRYLERARAAPMEPAPRVRLDPEEAVRCSDAFVRAMLARRSVRRFSDEPVPWHLIENAVRVAASAPSGANQQPWTYVIVSDHQLKVRLREAIECEERATYERRATDEWLEELAKLGTDWHKEHITTAPYLAVVFAQVHGLAPQVDGTTAKIKHYYVQESVGISVGLFIASLALAGLSTLTHTPNPMKVLGDILDRPQNERAYVVIPIGYAAPDALVPKIAKRPLETVLVTM